MPISAKKSVGNATRCPTKTKYFKKLLKNKNVKKNIIKMKKGQGRRQKMQKSVSMWEKVPKRPKKYNKKFLKVKKTEGSDICSKRPGKIDIEIKTIYGQKANSLVSISSILE